MSTTSMTYVLGGLRVSSTLPLFGALEASDGGDADVEVCEGPVSEQLDDADYDGPLYAQTDRQFLLRVDGLARILVEDGARVVIDRADGVDDADLQVLLQGSVFAALCNQRGLLVLHGSAVRVGDSAAAFVGASGTGKSTLASTLDKRGYTLIADDLCVVVPEDDRVLVHPFAPQLKLWAHTLNLVGDDPARHQRARRGLDKHWVSTEGTFDPEPVELRWLYLLAGRQQVDGPSVERLRGLRSMGVVANNTYRRLLWQAGRSELHVRLCEQVASRVAVHSLHREHGVAAVGDTVDLLVDQWREEQ